MAKAGKKHSTPETPLKAMSGLLYGCEVEEFDAGDEKHRKGPQIERVRNKLRKLFGVSIPPPGELTDAELVNRIRKAFADDEPGTKSGLPAPARKTVLRAAGRLD
jgi:hypothetical protein